MTTATTSAAATGAVGRATSRLEGYDKVTGAARYAGEIPYENLAHGWIATSTVARGRIRAVDTAAALALPGVIDVLHHGNAPHLTPISGGFLGGDPTTLLLQDDRVPHVGWPVALVLAETPEQAREAAEQLRVEYDTEPYDLDFGPQHPGVYDSDETLKGDVEAELAASPVVVDEEYTTSEMHHNAMEPHATVARWADGRLDVIDSNQGPTIAATHLAQLFSLDASAVRVRNEHVGGAFGSKGTLRPQAVLAAMAATVLHRPVRVVLTRRQMFSLVGYRSPTHQRIRLGADRDGRLRALDHQALSLTSQVHEFVETSAALSRVLYPARGHRSVNRSVRLDVPTPRWMRAPGEAPGSFALESAMDELAVRLDLDPIELRIRNEAETGPISGRPFTSRHLVECYREGARRFGWADRDPRPGRRREGRWLIGTGMAAATYTAGIFASTAKATAEADGTFTIAIAASDIGTGARTALAQIAADALEVPLERIRMRIADSDIGDAILAGGSFGTSSWSWAVIAAAEELRSRLAPGADIPPEGITVRIDTKDTLAALEKVERHSFGAQFAEVALDPATGEIRVRRMLGHYAVGRVVNPLTARNQLVGGMIWGLSMALHEEAVRDRGTGGHANADLAGYHFAANADVPEIEADWIEETDPRGPAGVKGLGEIGVVGASAAIANAVWHATGVRHRALPIRPDRVLAAGTALG